MYHSVFIGAHPDDVILSCAGTISKLVSNGKRCMILSLTAGENNNYNNGDTRKSEMEKSANILNSDFYFLELQDTNINNTIVEQNLLKELFVKWNPHFVFYHNPFDIHPDHAIVSELVKKSVFLLYTSAKLPLFQLKGYFYYQIIKTNAHTIIYNDFNAFCDISLYIKTKTQAVDFHMSQSPYIEQNKDAILMYNELLGKFVGCNFAEGFRYIPIDYNNSLMPIEKLFGEV